MKQTHPKKPVKIEYVNHGNVFGTGKWFTFYCGNCKRQVYGNAKKCEHCGAILQHKALRRNDEI